MFNNFGGGVGLGKRATLWLLPALALGGCSTAPAASISPCSQTRAAYLASPLTHQDPEDGKGAPRPVVVPNPATVGTRIAVRFPWLDQGPVGIYLAPAASDMVPALDSTRVATVMPQNGTVAATFVLPSQVGPNSCGESFPLKRGEPFLLFPAQSSDLARLHPPQIDRLAEVLYVSAPYRINARLANGLLHLSAQGMQGRFLLMSLVGPAPSPNTRNLGTAFVWKGGVSLTRKAGNLPSGRYTLLLRDIPGPAGFLYQVPLQIAPGGMGSSTVTASG